MFGASQFPSFSASSCFSFIGVFTNGRLWGKLPKFQCFYKRDCLGRIAMEQGFVFEGKFEAVAG